jgi:hypothetical protein
VVTLTPTIHFNIPEDLIFKNTPMRTTDRQLPVCSLLPLETNSTRPVSSMLQLQTLVRISVEIRDIAYELYGTKYFDVVHFSCSCVLYRFINRPNAAQLIYHLRHVSAATIRPSSGGMLFLDKQRMLY